MLSLRPMRDDEFDAFFEREVEALAQDTANSYKVDLDQVRQSTRAHLSRRLAGRLNTEDNYFFVAERSAESAEVVIGNLWISIDEKERYAWLDSIELREEFRGQGYGAQVLALLEEELSKRGIRSMTLHVAAHNEPALKLYQKTGFKFTGHNMKKDW